MMKPNEIVDSLLNMIPNAVCELNYNKDYELLIATVLSAQSTDKRVNMVTEKLFSKYDIFSLKDVDIKNIEEIIKPVGTYHRKALYIKKIAESLVNDYEGKVPNNRDYLESLPGVGHKTCNVILANLFSENCIAVDTHVSRVAKRFDIALESDNVLEIEKKLNEYFRNAKYGELHHRMVLFGRYICKARNPKCEECLLNKKCKHKKIEFH